MRVGLLSRRPSSYISRTDGVGWMVVIADRDRRKIESTLQLQRARCKHMRNCGWAAALEEAPHLCTSDVPSTIVAGVRSRLSSLLVFFSLLVLKTAVFPFCFYHFYQGGPYLETETGGLPIPAALGLCNFRGFPGLEGVQKNPEIPLVLCGSCASAMGGACKWPLSQARGPWSVRLSQAPQTQANREPAPGNI